MPESKKENEGDAVIETIPEENEEKVEDENTELIAENEIENVAENLDLEQRASPTARPQSRGSVSTTKKVQYSST